MLCTDFLRLFMLIGVIALGSAGVGFADGAKVGAKPRPREARQARRPGVEEIRKMLPDHPEGFGRTIDDRDAWDRLARIKSYQDLLRDAERLLKRPWPEQPDKLYLEFSQTGNRTRWRAVARDRRGRIRRYAIAESLENKGRFLRPLTEAIQAVCAERTWVLPAHDRGLKNFHGKSITIDLGSARLGYELATAKRLLGKKLDAKTRSLIERKITERIISPFQELIRGKRRNWWLTCTNNWNAVCLADVVGTGLTMLESPKDRAEFIFAGLKYSENFLRGFEADGYCSEGLAYWGYGFGHFVILAEVVHQATGGRIDMLDSDRVRQIAMFPERIEIINGVSPAFADCGVYTRPSRRLVHFLRRRYRLGAKREDDTKMISPSGDLFAAMMYSFPNSATKQQPVPARKDHGVGLRTWFNKAGVLICRPGAKARCRLGAAFKGGHNGEHHNHNDVGSYVVVLGSRPLLLDPGYEVYTARTFSKRRYESNVLNSFGHSVPRVAGRLQPAGRKYHGKVLKREFTRDVDTLVLDLRPAYDVPDMKKLHRTFIYSRRGEGCVEVIDEVEFASPQTFETALITLGKWRKIDDRTLVIYDDQECVEVRLDVQGGAFVVEAQEIREDVRTKSLPVRLSVRLTKPVKAARIAVKITPSSLKRAASEQKRKPPE